MHRARLPRGDRQNSGRGYYAEAHGSREHDGVCAFLRDISLLDAFASGAWLRAGFWLVIAALFAGAAWFGARRKEPGLPAPHLAGREHI
jgi:hypothetical protein